VFRYFGPGKGDLSVRGPCTRAHYKVAPSLPLTVRVVFAPGGAYPFFGVPVDALQDQLVLLEELWGERGRALLDVLLRDAEQGGDAARDAISAALDSRMCEAPFEPAAANAARAAVQLIAERDLDISEVADQLGVSARHLRRSFTATVGMRPKLFARVARFQRAVALGRHSAEGWSEIAQRTGYFDQAHLNADFQKFAGVSPATFRRDPAPKPLTVCT
jgi:AraC-like DNA-binding protein